MTTRKWNIKGTDGQIYTVVERTLPGRLANPLSGNRTVISSGNLDYVLADGSDVFDEPSGYWTTMDGVRLAKPANL